MCLSLIGAVILCVLLDLHYSSCLCMCHNLVPDALFLTLTPSQTLSRPNIYLYPTQRPTTCDPSSDLCLLPYSSLSPFAHDSFIMSHPLSIITNGRHHVKPFRTYLHAYCLVIYSISTCTPICLLIDSSLADNYSIVLPIILYNSH